jgi:hypothetical protein
VSGGLQSGGLSQHCLIQSESTQSILDAGLELTFDVARYSGGGPRRGGLPHFCQLVTSIPICSFVAHLWTKRGGKILGFLKFFQCPNYWPFMARIGQKADISDKLAVETSTHKKAFFSFAIAKVFFLSLFIVSQLFSNRKRLIFLSEN